MTLLMLVCQNLSAHDFDVDGIYYTVLSEVDKTASISLYGSENFSYDDEYSGNMVIPASVNTKK